MRRLALVAVVALAFAAPASAAELRGTYIGLVGGTGVAVVVEPNGVLAYVCDGEDTGIWLKGETLRSLKGPLRLRRDGRGITATYKRRTGTLAHSLKRPKGLYRAQIKTAGGKRKLAGWIVFAKHKQLGVVTSDSTTTSVPNLDTSTQTASGGFTAGLVTTTSSQQLAVVDTAGDGVKVSQRVSTSLLGSPKTLAVPPASDDDGIVAINGADLKRAGYTLRSASGTAISGTTTVTGGLRVTNAAGVTTTATGATHFIRLLAGKTGRLDLRTGPGLALRLRRDKRDARLDAEAELLAVVEKIRQDNSEIQQAIEDAAEKFNAAMNSGAVEAIAAIIAGMTATASGAVAECAETVVTVGDPPRTFTLRYCGYPATV